MEGVALLAEEGKAPEYVCPMHPQIRQTEPGSCPLCGMFVKPVIGGRLAQLLNRLRRSDGLAGTLENLAVSTG